MELRQQVRRLDNRVTFLEELLEAPAHLRLRGGGKKGGAASTVALPECYEQVFHRAHQLCPHLAKPQIRNILRADAPLCTRLNKSDDASLIRIIAAAVQRLGMVPPTKPTTATAPKDGADAKEEPPRRSRSVTSASKQSPIQLGECDKACDEELVPVLTLESIFNVPTVTSLRPGEDGVVLGEGADVISHMLTRFAGSSGTSAVIAPSKYPTISIEPVEMVLQFKKAVKDQVDQHYMCLAYLYRLTANTPELKKEAPVVKLQAFSLSGGAQ